LSWVNPDIDHPSEEQQVELAMVLSIMTRSTSKKRARYVIPSPVHYMLSDTLQAARLTVKHEDRMSDDDEVIEVTRTDFLHAGGSAAIAAADDDDSMSWTEFSDTAAEDSADDRDDLGSSAEAGDDDQEAAANDDDCDSDRDSSMCGSPPRRIKEAGKALQNVSAYRSSVCSKLSLRSLCNTRTSTKDVLKDIGMVHPQLLPSEPAIAELLRWKNARPFPSQAVPQYEKSPANFPTVSPRLDQVWNRRVAGEPRPPGEFDLDPAMLVKPHGNMADPIILMTSFPRYDTSRLEYNTVGDVTSTCMCKMLYKMEQEKIGVRASGVTLCDLLPRRLHTDTTGLDTEDLATLTDPQIAALYRYWADETFHFLREHQGHVLILSDSKVHYAYRALVREGRIDAEAICFTAKGGKEDIERPVAWKEISGHRTRPHSHLGADIAYPIPLEPFANERAG
jgi:hypothetical protein